MSFGITPASGFPPQASDEFPNYLQWRQDGVNLGAPNIDTVDLVGDVSATRGTGENANVLTIAVASNPSGGGVSTATPFVAFKLAASGSGNGISSWTTTSLVDDATVGSWNDTTDEFTFAAAGVYEVRVGGRLTMISNAALYGGVNSSAGSGPDDLTTGSRHSVDSATQEQFNFTDEFLLTMVGGDLVRNFQVTLDNAEQSLDATLSIVITKLL